MTLTATPEQLSTAMEQFIRRLFGMSESEGMEALIGLDLSFSQARTIFALSCASEPVAINVIADRLDLSMAAAGRNVDQLLGLDLVHRHESEADRRVKLVSLTTAGEKIVQQHFEAKLSSNLTSFFTTVPDAKSFN